ncbi:MAG: rod shape-determining protein RodA [Pseudobdellovibrionaceae bacterium]
MDLSLQVEERTLFRRIDWNLILVMLALQLVGLINLYSATHGPHSEGVEQLFVNQMIWLTAGWTIFMVATFVEYSILMKLAYVFYFLNLGAILWVTLFGNVALGAQRWIDFGFFKYQPSETMKMCLIMILAKILSQFNTTGRGMGFKELFWPVLILLIPFGLVVEQPDLGTALMLTAIGSSMILFCKVRKSILISAILAIAVAIPMAWNYGLRDYQKNRVINFIDPMNDPQGTGYNSIQSRIAVGSGQLVGKGFRKGTQSQLEFLPERHTDFIYSVLSEEHGFIGSLTTIGLFAVLFLIGVRIASTARDKFGALLVVGVLCYVFWHMFVNIGMVIGLLPIVGVPLPLLSYGGSGMITTMTGLGIVSSVAYRRYIF